MGFYKWYAGRILGGWIGTGWTGGLGLSRLVLECVQSKWMVVGIQVEREADSQVFFCCTTQASPSICLFSDWICTAIILTSSMFIMLVGVTEELQAV
jgi:hypothetical protein